MQRAASVVLRAVLFRDILTPLAAGLGPLAETVVATVADRVVAEPRR